MHQKNELMTRYKKLTDLPPKYRKQAIKQQADPMPARIELVLNNRKTPSLNTYLNWHWTKKRKQKTSIRHHLALAGATFVKPPTEPRY